MTYGDDRTAGAMSDDERRNYVRQDGAAMAAPPDGPSRELRERLIELMAREPQFASFTLAGDVARVDAILAEIIAAGYVIVPESLMASIKGIAVLMRMAFDGGAGVDDCEITDGQILDRLMATVEMLEDALSGDREPVGGGE